MAKKAERSVRRWLGVLFSVVNGGVAAQTSSESARSISGEIEIVRPAWQFAPRVEWTETLTSNLNLGAGAQSALVSELAPGFRLRGNTARVKADIDYALRGISYDANDGYRTRKQQALKAFGSIELVDRWLFLDFSGAIAQQAISPFGPQNTSGVNLPPNVTETSTIRVSPFVRGKLVGSSDYEVRYRQTSLYSSATAAADVKTTEATARLNDVVSNLLAWSINASRRQDHFDGGHANEADRARVSFTVSPVSEIHLSLSGGREANNYASATKASHTTSGYTLRWTPSSRTEAAIGHERRFFGSARSLRVRYRTPRTVWQFSESRDISVAPNQFESIGLGNNYDILYAQSAEPDPIKRAELVTDNLEKFGLPADTPVTADFLISRMTVQRARDLSIAWNLPRTTLTAMARETRSEAISAASIGATDVFSANNQINQYAVSLTIAHRVTPLSSLRVKGLRQRTTSSAGATVEATLKSVETGVTTRLGARTAAAFTLRRNDFDSPTTPYQETAVAGTLSVSF